MSYKLHLPESTIVAQEREAYQEARTETYYEGSEARDPFDRRTQPALSQAWEDGYTDELESFA